MRPALPLAAACAAAVLCAAVLAGCGGSGSSTSGGATGGASTAAPPAGSSAGGPPGASVSSCGGGLQATGVPCAKARAVKGSWDAAPGCQLGPGDSHVSCRVDDFLCISAKVEGGVVVSCALPGRDVFFRERG